MNEWLVIPNWEKFQHYKDRDPTWIKLYLDLRSRDEWRRLTLAARGLLVSCWIEYAASNGRVRREDIPARVASKSVARSLDSLQAAGFVAFSSRAPLELARARALAREEKEKESTTSNSKNEKPELLPFRDFLETLR